MTMMNRFTLLFVVYSILSVSAAAAFAPVSSKMLSPPSLLQHSFSRCFMAPVTAPDKANVVEQDFDMLVNKNKKGAMQDIEERTERLSLDISKTTYTALMKSPPDTYISFAEKGASNAHLPKRKILHQSILGGCYVGFGGLISLLIAGNLGGLSVASPAIAKMAFAALFPINLLLIVATSGQLFTGNSATVSAARYEGFVSTSDMWRSLALSLLGNVIGCTLFAIAAVMAQVMNPGATDLVIKTAISKCCSVGLVATFMRAVMCNWMVSMAVFLATSANDLTGKMLGCYLPISTFIGIGLEHSVANLFILPLALMLGAPLTLQTIIFKNLIPVIIGNGVAGAFIVAASYSYQFGRLGGLRRAVFAEKLANIQKDLARKRKLMDLELQLELSRKF
jgi:formate/nitrite transporter